MKTVIHYKYGSYLPLTETWIHSQIKTLKIYSPIIYSLYTENLEIFPTSRLRYLKKNVFDKNASFFLNRKFNRLFGFYPSFCFGILKDKPLLVHAHFGDSGYYFLKLKKMFNLPLITTFYGFDLSSLPKQYPEWRGRYNQLFQEGEVFLVEGNHMKKSLVQLGCMEEKIIVQHLGIDLEKIKFVPRTFDKEEGEIKILISSSFREKKGIPYAVEAFGIVKNAYPNLKLKLTIIGDARPDQPSDQFIKNEIFNLVQKYNLNNCVNMLGYKPYSVFLEELYKHHIFLHPSIHASDGDSEGGAPVSIIEASASGMPILSTKHCDIPEVVIDGESGYCVPERDLKSLVEKLEFLVLNSEMWGQMGLVGRQHIDKEYSVVRQVELLEKIYDKVLAK